MSREPGNLSLAKHKAAKIKAKAKTAGGPDSRRPDNTTMVMEEVVATEKTTATATIRVSPSGPSRSPAEPAKKKSKTRHLVDQPVIPSAPSVPAALSSAKATMADDVIAAASASFLVF